MRAFSDTTGMPIVLRAVEHSQSAMGGAANENRPSIAYSFQSHFSQILGKTPANYRRSFMSKK
jgi:hypothetical protein